MNSDPKILAVGAAGRYAGLTVPALVARGADVRGMVRDPGQVDVARRNGVTDVVVGDLRDRASLDRAMHGVDGAYFIAPVYPNDESQRTGRMFVQAAKDAGVRRIVFSSVFHPVLSALENHIQKVPIEEAVIESDLEFTILNPAHFYQNTAAIWPQVMATGVFAEPFSNSMKLSRVDYRDVAEVVAIGLTEDRLVNGTFELCADGGLDRCEVAAVMSDVLGRPVTAEATDIDTWLARTNLPQDDYSRNARAKMYGYYDTHGLVGNTLTLRAILGREPRSLRQFFIDLNAGEQTTAR
jgi:uncharacterized protein YbjT (DUF2867 family)